MKVPGGGSDASRCHNLADFAEEDSPQELAGFWLARVCGELLRAARALDDHWLGDLIGAVCLFALGWMGLAIGWVLQ